MHSITLHSAQLWNGASKQIILKVAFFKQILWDYTLQLGSLSSPGINFFFIGEPIFSLCVKPVVLNLYMVFLLLIYLLGSQTSYIYIYLLVREKNFHTMLKKIFLPIYTLCFWAGHRSRESTRCVNPMISRTYASFFWDHKKRGVIPVIPALVRFFYAEHQKHALHVNLTGGVDVRL